MANLSAIVWLYRGQRERFHGSTRSAVEFREVSMPRSIDLGLERSWRQRLRQFERSGLSVRQFCRAEGVEEYTFFWWRRELAKRDRMRDTVRSTLRRSPLHRAKVPPIRRRHVDRIPRSLARPQQSHQTPAFVPVHVIAEPLAPSCMEFRIGTSLVRVPISIDERALRQAIRVLREETTGC